MEELRTQVKGIHSLLRMLEGNTLPEDIKKLEELWLGPIQRLIDGLKSES